MVFIKDTIVQAGGVYTWVVSIKMLNSTLHVFDSCTGLVGKKLRFAAMGRTKEWCQAIHIFKTTVP